MWRSNERKRGGGWCGGRRGGLRRSSSPQCRANVHYLSEIWIGGEGSPLDAEAEKVFIAEDPGSSSAEATTGVATIGGRRGGGSKGAVEQLRKTGIELDLLHRLGRMVLEEGEEGRLSYASMITQCMDT